MHVDFAGPSFLEMVDAHSKWPKIFPMQNADTRSIIVIFKQLFSQHSLLESLVSDNGLQFISKTDHL